MRKLFNEFLDRPWWVTVPWFFAILQFFAVLSLTSGWRESKFFSIPHEDLIFIIQLSTVFIVEAIYQLYKKEIK